MQPQKGRGDECDFGRELKGLVLPSLCHRGSRILPLETAFARGVGARPWHSLE